MRRRLGIVAVGAGLLGLAACAGPLQPTTTVTVTYAAQVSAGDTAVVTATGIGTQTIRGEWTATVVLDTTVVPRLSARPVTGCVSWQLREGPSGLLTGNFACAAGGR